MLFCFCFMANILAAQPWNQIGTNIIGEAPNDRSGWSVALSNDGNIVAIGARFNAGGGDERGHVRVYQWVGGVWTQLGNDIDGSALQEHSGHAVSLSADGLILAIGSPDHNGGGIKQGRVRVFQYSGGTWIPLGGEIFGENAYEYAGFSVDLSSDGQRIAVGAPEPDIFNPGRGVVRVYKLVNGSWTKQGSDMLGEGSTDGYGRRVSLSSDGLIVAASTEFNDGGGINRGHVRIHKFTGGAWAQQGADIDGEADNDGSGFSLSLSGDGNTVAIGAPWNNDGGTGRGHARVYKFTGGIWAKQGQDIDGQTNFESLGESVSLSADGTFLAVGSPNATTFKGKVQVFKWQGGVWTPVGDAILGQSVGDKIGWQANLTPDGSKLAVAAPYQSLGMQHGHVMLYGFDATAPDINLQGNNVDILNGDNTPSASDHTNFGSTPLGTNLIRTFTIQNKGNAPLNVASVAVSDNVRFWVGPLSLSGPIPPNGSATFNATFQSSAMGVFNATISAQSDDADEAAYNFAIQAEATCVAPQFTTCPNAQVVNTDLDQCTAALVYSAVATGNPLPNFQYFVSGDGNYDGPGTGSGINLGKGTYQMTILATNNCGSASCVFAVVIKDTQNPTIVCPSNLVLNTDLGQCSALVVYPDPVATDNCTPAPTRSRTNGGASGSLFPMGLNTVAWKATDGAGLTATCTFTVKVQDTQAPSIACPANQIVGNAPGQCAGNATYLTPTASDNCALPNGQPTWVSGGSAPSSNGANSISTFPKGSTTVVWKATDAAGLVKTCSFKITVNDTENPAIICPNNQTVNASSGQCAAVVNYPMPTASDNCTPAPTCVRINGLPSGATFPSGANTVIWRALDGVGRSATCSFVVNVVDNQNPTITCPPNIAQTNPANNCNAPVIYATPAASDNCALNNIYLESGLASGSVFPVGVSTVTWRAMDANGHSSACTFTVAVSCGAPRINNGQNAISDRSADAGSSSFVLSPNPTVSLVRFEALGLSEQAGELLVLDALGKLVLRQELDLGEMTGTFDASSWGNGVYQVCLKLGQTLQAKILVVNTH